VKIAPQDFCSNKHGDIFCTELKRKADGTPETGPVSKLPCVEKKCTDLIVLGLPFKSSEEELKQYFSQYGQLVLVQVVFIVLLSFIFDQ